MLPPKRILNDRYLGGEGGGAKFFISSGILFLALHRHIWCFCPAVPGLRKEDERRDRIGS